MYTGLLLQLRDRQAGYPYRGTDPACLPLPYQYRLSPWPDRQQRPAHPPQSIKEEVQNHSSQRTILGFYMPPTGVEPVLCFQKGILSPSCLPAFGKFNFRSLYRLIFHCERDFSFANERDSHFFDKIILPPFSFHVNHVKLFHLVVLDPRSVRDPGLPPGGVRPAQMRSSGWV